MNNTSDRKSFVIQQATRQGIIPLFGLWGGTGSGKTRSGLMLARGMAGPKGRVGIIDTEHRRACYYADIQGGFLVIDFAPPYTPERYWDALDELERNCDVGILDSASHLWEGPDGICDLHEQMLDRMVGDGDWKKRESLNWPAWREPKQRFKPVKQKILGFTKPLIVCFRGEEKTRMVKDSNGRNTVVTDTTTSPIFDRKFIFEMHVAIETFQKDGIGGYVRFPMPYAKTSHTDLRNMLPKAEVEQLTVEHGAKIIHWCNNVSGTSTPPPATAQKKAPTEVAKLKNELFTLTDQFHNGDALKMAQYLLNEDHISDTEVVSDLGAARLTQVIASVKSKLGQPTQ